MKKTQKGGDSVMFGILYGLACVGVYHIAKEIRDKHFNIDKK